MLMKYNTLKGVKGEVLLYFHSKAFLPGTDIYGPLSGPVFVSEKYAKLCINRGFNVEVVRPEKHKAIVKHRSKQPKSIYDDEAGLEIFKERNKKTND